MPDGWRRGNSGPLCTVKLDECFVGFQNRARHSTMLAVKKHGEETLTQWDEGINVWVQGNPGDKMSAQSGVRN